MRVCVRIFTRLTLYLHSSCIFMFVAATTTFLMFLDFLMVEQIFFSLQMKRTVIIRNTLVYTNCLTSCRTT